MIDLDDEKLRVVQELSQRENLPVKEVLDAAKTLIFCGQDLSELPALLGTLQAKN